MSWKTASTSSMRFLTIKFCTTRVTPEIFTCPLLFGVQNYLVAYIALLWRNKSEQFFHVRVSQKAFSRFLLGVGLSVIRPHILVLRKACLQAGHKISAHHRHIYSERQASLAKSVAIKEIPQILHGISPVSRFPSSFAFVDQFLRNDSGVNFSQNAKLLHLFDSNVFLKGTRMDETQNPAKCQHLLLLTIMTQSFQ